MKGRVLAISRALAALNAVYSVSIYESDAAPPETSSFRNATRRVLTSTSVAVDKRQLSLLQMLINMMRDSSFVASEIAKWAFGNLQWLSR